MIEAKENSITVKRGRTPEQMAEMRKKSATALREKAALRRKTVLTKSDAMRKHLMKRVGAELDPILDGQIQAAKGFEVMMARELIFDSKKGDYKRTGRWYQVTNPSEILELLNGEEEGNEDSYYRIVTQKADIQAARELIQQAIGRPKENVEVKGQILTLAAIVHKVESNK